MRMFQLVRNSAMNQAAPTHQTPSADDRIQNSVYFSFDVSLSPPSLSLSLSLDVAQSVATFVRHIEIYCRGQEFTSFT